MNIFQILPFLFSLFSITLAEGFCNDATDHSGDFIALDANKKGNVGPVDYELWANGGNNSATFYTDGSFTCGFTNTTDYLCRAGINISPAKLPSEVGHIKAEFKVEKTSFENVQYSYIGVYGWTLESGISRVFEYYIVDDVLVPIPDDFANELIGDFIIDDAEYTVYRNIKGMLTQYFSVRKEPRSCGTIDVTAHFEQWEKVGFEMGKISEVKVLGEAGNDFGNVYGSLNFPYAKVYIDGEVAQSQAYVPTPEQTIDLVEDEEATTVAVDQEEEVTALDSEDESDDSEEEYEEEFCNGADHSGDFITLDANKKGNVGPVDYELWANGGENSATFYTDGSFTCGFTNTTDYLCRAGINISPAKLPSEIGHIKANSRLKRPTLKMFNILTLVFTDGPLDLVLTLFLNITLLMMSLYPFQMISPMK